MTLGILLNPQRANRMVQQAALDKTQMGLDGMLATLVAETLFSKVNDPYKASVQESINYNVLKHLMNLSVHPKAIPQTKAFAKAQLKKIRTQLALDAMGANSAYMVDEINNFLKSPEKFIVMASPKIPDGSPIGCFDTPIYSN